jgi:hypothetical protein
MKGRKLVYILVTLILIAVTLMLTAGPLLAKALTADSLSSSGDVSLAGGAASTPVSPANDAASRPRKSMISTTERMAAAARAAKQGLKLPGVGTRFAGINPATESISPLAPDSLNKRRP